MTLHPRNLSTTSLAITACLLWSTAFAGIKIGLPYTTPIGFAGLRFFLAGLLLLPLAGRLGATLRLLGAHWRRVALISLFTTTVAYTFFYTGLSMGTASTTAIVVGAGPLFVAVMAHLFLANDRLSGRTALSLLFGLTGIWIIARSRYAGRAEDGAAFVSVLLLIGSNISAAIGSVLVVRCNGRVPAIVLSSSQFILGGALLLVISLFAEGVDISPKPPAYWGSLVYLTLLSAGAMTLWFAVLGRPGVRLSQINLWKFIIPVLGALLSWAVLDDERPDAEQLVGMAAVAGALVLMYLRPPAGGRPRPAPRNRDATEGLG